MKSPFKFLDAYTLADKNAFFGRDKEIEDLYQMVFKTPLILVYGLSGTGKTSLIQCGLAGKFDGPDWLPLFIRRRGDFRKAIKEKMDEVTNGHAGETLVDSVTYLFGYYLRPVYLIFDQFEELFTDNPSEEEQTAFREEIQALLDGELPCKIMLIMREEYIGQLYEMEKHIPTIFDYRLRVEPMSNTKVKDVMASSFKKFNISLEGEADERLQEMADNISAGKAGVQLPYLQVYLDMLYREDYARTYGKNEPEEALPPLEFSKREIADFGKIDDVLEKFLEEQVGNLQSAVRRNSDFRDSPDNAVKKVLDAFVTEDGTKRPVFYERDDHIKLTGPAATMLSGIPENALTWILDNLEIRRILRFSKDQIELAHDSLAAKIDEKRTDEQRQLNEIKKRLKNLFLEHQQTEGGVYLTSKQLNTYEDFVPRLTLEQPVLDFIEDSHRYVMSLEAEERRKQEEKIRLVEEKLEAETRAKKRQRIFTGIIGIIGIGAIILGVFASNQAKSIKSQAFWGAIKNGHASVDIAQYDAAFDHLKKAIEFKIAGVDDTLTTLENNWKRLAELVPQAEAMRENEEQWLQALENYRLASKLTDAPMIGERISDLEKNIEAKFVAYKNSATMITQFADCGPEACSVFRLAKQLKPEDAELKEAMMKCNCQ